MNDDIKKWLDFYYGTTDVPPAKIADSLAGFGFDGYSRYTRTKADEAQNRRVMEYAKHKGYEIKTDEYRPEGYMDSDAATKLNKELDGIRDKAREAAWVNRDESELLAEVASPQRGFENILDSKPSLAYGGVREDVAADGFMMLIGYGAKDFLSKLVFGKRNLKEVGSEKLVKENIAESSFPDYKALIPRKDRLTGELRVIGTKYNPQQSGFDVFLTDGEGLIGVQANKFAWLREKLPTAKIYGSILVESKMREKEGELVRDKNGAVIWDETVTNKLDPGAPISFVVDEKTVGVLMPMFYAKGWGKKSLEDSTFPDVIKDAISPVAPSKAGLGKSVKSGELYDKNKYDYLEREGSETSLQSIHDSRSPRSRESDERLSNADTIEPDDPRVEQWVKDQGRSDIVGIDTPRKHKSKKVVRKVRKSTRTETQVRGIRK